MSLTVTEVRQGLDGLGTPKLSTNEEGRTVTRCPACGIDDALTFSEDAFGKATLDCEHDTPEDIEKKIRQGLARIELLNDNPLGYVKDILDEPGLTEIIKHGRGGASYVLHYTDGDQVELGSIAALLSQPKFKAAYLPQRRRMPTKHTLKDAQWVRLVEAIERASVERDTVTGDTEEVRGWLARYLRSTKAVDLNTEDTEGLYDFLTADAGPFTDPHGRLHIRLSDLAAWINQIGGGRITSRDLSARLSELGFEHAQPSARRPSHVHKTRQTPDVRKQRYYASPPNLDLDA